MERYNVHFFGDSGLGHQLKIAEIVSEAEVVFVDTESRRSYILEKYGREAVIGKPPTGSPLKVICSCTCSDDGVAARMEKELYELRKEFGADIQLIYSMALVRHPCVDRILSYKRYVHEVDKKDVKIKVDVKNFYVP